MRRFALILASLALLTAAVPAVADTFKVGYGVSDITPEKAMPMWGYGARHDKLSEGVLDPLLCKAVVIDVGDEKLALVGLDLGRGPTAAMTGAIRKTVQEKAGVTHVLMSGSHTHHGPIIELLDEPGKGGERFPYAVEYAEALPGKISKAIIEAAQNVQRAKIGWGARDTDFNRNRHTKKRPKPRDPELAVVRFDDLKGGMIALMVNFAAHPTIHKMNDRRFTSEWPGRMYQTVEAEMNTNCFFMQGAAGDLSANTNSERKGIDGFGKAIAAEVMDMAKDIETRVPVTPDIRAMDEEFAYDMRIPIERPIIQGAFKVAFFPELVSAMLVEYENSIMHARMDTVLLNGELALVGGSGEFFCEHANRLKAESAAPETLWIGYCNGHHMYFPTRDAIEEGGYGADPLVSWVPPGAGEDMITKALENIDKFLGAFNAITARN